MDHVRKLGVILSFVVALGGLVLLADALVDERPLPPTAAPLEDGDRKPEPVITITDIPVSAGFAAPGAGQQL